MIISASRRTDIPAFYSEWFINRLKEGFLYVRNPFNTNQISKINLSPEFVECIVFWTKNPAELLKNIKVIDDLGYKYYFQFTVNSYDSSIETYVPRKKEVINTFLQLADKIGPEKVIWRYDPILLTDKFNIEYHLKWYEYIASSLQCHTKKCVISFVDMYKKCERNLKEITIEKIHTFDKQNIARELYNISKKYNIILETCAEEVELNNEGIIQGKCIDDALISKIINYQVFINKDKTQREECGCVASVDIGSYNTCKHGCKYCYANFSHKAVEDNYSAHDKYSPLLSGKMTGKEKITERKIVKVSRKQQSLFSN